MNYPDEIVWLIERNVHADVGVSAREYYNGYSWVRDPMKACRYPDEEAVKSFVRSSYWRTDANLEVCSHIFWSEPTDPCPHLRQSWTATMMSGVCLDCGEVLPKGVPDRREVCPSDPAHM